MIILLWGRKSKAEDGFEKPAKPCWLVESCCMILHVYEVDLVSFQISRLASQTCVKYGAGC